MAITAATRQDIIELVVTALNAAPGTTLLNELVAIVDGGGTLADVAANLAASDTFTARYPAFQTAEEFAAEWLGNLIPEAGADAMAEAKALVVAAVNGGTSAASLILQAQEFLSSASETDAAFGTSAANFNNKAEVASHQTLTNETAALDTSALNSVTSDDATVATAKTALDTVATPGTSAALTKNVDSLTGGAGDDTYSATSASAATLTLNAGDTVDGGAGTDTITITGSTSGGQTLGAGVVLSNIENVKVNAVTSTSLDASLWTGVTDYYNSGSLDTITVTGAAAIPNVHVIGSSSDASVAVAAAKTVGTADSTTIALNGSAVTSSNTITMNKIETFNVVASGTASGTATNSTTLVSDALHTVNITGDAGSHISVDLTGATSTQVGTITGNDQANRVTMTGAHAADKISVSLGDGNDTLSIASISKLHTLDGGDGVDTFTSSAAVTAATGVGIKGFENVSIGAVSVALSAAANTIDAVTFTGTGGSLAGLAAGATVTDKAGGANTVSNATGWTGSSDSLTVNVGSAIGSGTLTSSVTANGIETATITNSEISTSNSARTVGVTSNTLTKATVSSDTTGTITFVGGGTKMTELDMSGVAGATSFTASATNTAAAGFTFKAGAKASTLTGRTGADTLVGGAGADTITGAQGIDTLTGGGGADTFSFAANAAGSTISTLIATDTITDFVSGTDKIAVSQTLTAFIGNFSTVSQAQAAAAADARGNLAYYVTGEELLYVVAATNGIAVSTAGSEDTVIKLPGVASLAAGDLQLGSQGTGATVVLAAGPAVSTTASNAVSSTKTTAKDDTITASEAAKVVGASASIDGGLGNDSLTATVKVSELATLDLTTAGAIGTGDTSGGVALSNVETVTFNIADTAGGTLTVNSVPTTVSSLAVNGANAAVAATITATGQTISTNNSTIGGNSSTITFSTTALASQTGLGGASNDTFNTIQVDRITANGGAGDDTFNITAAAALDDDAKMLTIIGGTGTDDITLAAASTGAFDFSDTTDVSISGIETYNLGAVGAALVVTLPAGNTVTTITGTADTNKNFTVNMTAAQLDALTTLTAASTSGGSAGVVKLVVNPATASDAVTVDLSDLTFTTLANHAGTGDLIDFNSVTGVTTVTADQNFLVRGGAGTSDVLNYTATGAGTMLATGFETVNFTTAAQAGSVTAPVGAVTINTSVGQAGLTVADATTAMNVTAGASTITDTTTAAKSVTVTNSGSGAVTVNLVADGAAADTVVNSGTGTVTVNLTASTGLSTVTLGANNAADTISFAGASIGITAATDLVTITGFGSTDVLDLDDDQTTQAGGNTMQIVTAAGAVTTNTAVTVYSFDMGGSTNVLGGVTTGAALVANAGGAITTTNGDDGYIIAYDGGNAYLYEYVESGNTTLAGSEITLIAVLEGVAVGGISNANLSYT